MELLLHPLVCEFHPQAVLGSRERDLLLLLVRAGHLKPHPELLHGHLKARHQRSLTLIKEVDFLPLVPKRCPAVDQVADVAGALLDGTL
jgi:hypothetical protein